MKVFIVLLEKKILHVRQSLSLEASSKGLVKCFSKQWQQITMMMI
jgi:hypothetical protein